MLASILLLPLYLRVYVRSAKVNFYYQLHQLQQRANLQILVDVFSSAAISEQQRENWD